MLLSGYYVLLIHYSLKHISYQLYMTPLNLQKLRTLWCLIYLLLTILIYCAFLVFLNYWLVVFNSCCYYKICNPTEELVMPIGIPSNEAKAEIETQLLIAGNKINDCLISFKFIRNFLHFFLITLFRMVLFGAAKKPPSINLSHICCNDEIWHSYTFPKKIQKYI